MRHLTIILVCLAATAAYTQEPAQSPSPQPSATPFKQVTYADPKSTEKITITGPGSLIREENGRKFTGTYAIEGKKMHVRFDGSYSAEGTGPKIYDIEENGLQDDEYGQLLMNEAAFANYKVEQQCLSNAKQIALGCRLYAADNDGKFPDKLEDLVPTYIQDKNLFVSPLSAKNEAMGYEYFGKGGTDSDRPDKVFLRSKDAGPDGKRVVVLYDSSGHFEEVK